ncbi:MAG TPA: hypothetical protein VF585_05290 [Chthoniobacterales bacterium]|jgi:hypothetical protein
MQFAFIVLAAAVLSLTTTRAEDWPAAGARAYWNQGKAEISRYALLQNRYGELHSGDAVLIFVSEPFSRSKQVKLDDYASAGGDLVNVLKLNFTKTFLTGIYPYSLMLSTFSPADGASPALKVTMSGQEWCGHVFSQLNRRGDHLELQDFSYFESDGDRKTSLPAAILEDEMWARIRLNPEALPVGKLEIIPGSFAARFMHLPQKVEKAEASVTSSEDVITYSLRYLSGSDRELQISFKKDFPHQITGWSETYTDFSGKRLTTTGKLTKTILSDYWKHHQNADRMLRKDLDLSLEH